ncbi:hypothetical protein K2X33_15920 [bacterium]|nr:hypothetical protein [bacterium]
MKGEFRHDFLWKALFTLRFGVLLLACLLPLSDPHTHRQTDTLGIAQRYYQRWFQAPQPEGWKILAPAALNSAEGFGYVATEAPLLNWLVAPAFFFGPYAGMAIAHLIWLLLVFGALLFAYKVWGLNRIEGIPVGWVALVFPLIGLGAIFTSKTIPDPLAAILVFAAVGASYARARPVLSFSLLAVGLLLKPTAVVGLGWIFLSPRWDWKRWTWIPWGIAVALVYYLGIVPKLAAFQDSAFPFYVGLRPPWESLFQFVTDAKGFAALWGRHYFTQVGVVLVLLAYAFGRGFLWRRTWPLWALLTLQTLAVGALDGRHAHQHLYYFMGLVPTVCFLFLQILNGVELPYWLRWMLLLVCLVNVSRLTLREWHDSEPSEVYRMEFYDSCEKLKARHPEFPWGQGKPFRSDYENYPTLGMCFGERSAARSGAYGFFRAENLPSDCKQTDREGGLVLATCP